MGRSTIESVKERAHARWDKLTDQDLDSVKEGASALASRLSERYGFDWSEARHQAEKFLDSTSEIASSAYDRTLGATAAASGRIGEAMRDNPWRAILGAIALGTIVGYALGNGGRRRRHW